jgi:hypothetical protein
MTVYARRRNGIVGDTLRLSTDGGASFQATPGLPDQWPQKIEGRYYVIKQGSHLWELDSVFISDTPDFAVMQRLELPEVPPPAPPLVLLNTPQLLAATGDTLIYCVGVHSWHLILPNQQWEYQQLPLHYLSSVTRKHDQNYYLTTETGRLYRSTSWGGPYTQLDPVQLSVVWHTIHHVGSTGWVKHKPGFGLMTTTDLGLTWQTTTLNGLPRSGLDSFDYDASLGQFVGRKAGLTWLNDPSTGQWRLFAHPNGALRPEYVWHTEGGFWVTSSTNDSLFIDQTTDFINFKPCLHSAHPAEAHINHNGFAHIDRSTGLMHWYDPEQCAIERSYALPVSFKYGYFAQIKGDTLSLIQYPDTLYSTVDGGLNWQKNLLHASTFDAFVTIVADTLYQIDPTLALWRNTLLGQPWQKVHNSTVLPSRITQRDDLIAATEWDGTLNRSYYLTRNPARGWLRWIGAQIPFDNNVVVVQDTVFFNSSLALYRAVVPVLTQRLRAQTTSDAYEPAASALSFNVVPNPASDICTIQLPQGALPKSIQVADMQGRVIVDLAAELLQTIPVHALAAGTYLVTVRLRDGRVGRQRLVKL